jgi:hypothetical protein
VPLELLEGSLLEGRDDPRIGRVRKHHVAALVKELGLLEVRDLDLAADVLRALTPLELDPGHAEGLDGVLQDARHRVFAEPLPEASQNPCRKVRNPAY